ncbi:restriction endonuclease subunit S [Enterobacter wuhouensis]|uniref:restriction endonuclease subunit S n=1 Tax=Enterobacter wuhouensis TaxID=2529381 RepID=UPI003D778FA9
MAKYKAYPEYKDSGVEWLGEIPKDWDAAKLKYIADLLTTKSTCTSALYVGLENISSANGKYVSKEESIIDGTSISFEENDILFGKLRPYLAKSWLATFAGVCSSEFLVLRTAKLNSRFLNYYSLTNEFIEQVNSSTYGSKMPRASWEFIGQLPVPTCSYSLSEKIASFLEHETAKIDTLIEKQCQLIELLKEKRQAVISHAVTKGLNPNVPMKDSGVEWLDSIPKKWTPTQVKYGFNITLGKMLQKTKQSVSDELKPYLKAQNIQPNGINLDIVDKMWFSDTEKQRLKLKINDILISEGGDIGRSVIWKAELEECYIQNAINRARPLSKNSSSFFYYWMVFLKSSDYINIICNKATIAHYTAEKLECTPIFLPDEIQQEIISIFLDDETAKIDTLIQKQLQQIDLLKERRAALISAAVTGKIDLRDWTPPASSAEASLTAEEATA